MNQKVFIVCLDKNKALNVAKEVIYKDDNYTIAQTFTTDNEYDNNNDNYEMYLDANTVNLSYKNNSLLYIKTTKYISTGITIDEFYNNDICVMNIDEYNLISEHIFNKYDIITVWIDTKAHQNLLKSDFIEINYFTEFLEKNPFLYFLDTEINIADVIIDYLNSDEEMKKHILEENN